jgi:hypothetical protein
MWPIGNQHDREGFGHTAICFASYISALGGESAPRLELLIGAGVGIERQVEELVLEALLGGLIGEGLAAGGGGDDGQELKLGDGGTGDIDALGVGTGVGRGEEEAGIVDEGVEQGAVGGGEALEQVA